MADPAVVDDAHIEPAVREPVEGALHRSDDPAGAIPERTAAQLGKVDGRARLAAGILDGSQKRALVCGLEDEPGERFPLRPADGAVRQGESRAEGLGHELA